MAKRKTLAKKGRKNRKTKRNLLKRGGGLRDIIHNKFPKYVSSEAEKNKQREDAMKDKSDAFDKRRLKEIKSFTPGEANEYIKPFIE
jgi:hypothetical protein